MSTSDPLHATSAQPPASGGRDAVRGLGADILAAVDVETITARLLQLPTATLLAELEAVVATVDHTDPERSRRRTGWWGRLLGRDLVAQAQPDPVGSRVRLHLAAAQTQADALATHTAALEPVANGLQQHTADLEALIARERTTNAATATDHADALQRRLAHLGLIASSWRITLAQIALVRNYAAQLLDRHAQVRDVFASLWHERNAAHAATTHIAPDRLARLHQALRELRATTPAFPAPAADTDRPTQDPSP